MILSSNLTWINDIDKLISSFPEFSWLEGKTILVTGATGLICSAVVDTLIRYNETQKGQVNIVVAGRNPETVKSRFGSYCDKDYFDTVYYDASKADEFYIPKCDYIIHGASNAYPSRIMSEPVETMLSNFLGIKNLLDFARKKDVTRLLYISSSEVYGINNSDDPYKENEYGYIDILNPRNSYSISKRAAETLCISYANEYGIDSVIARPGHIYGPTATQEDNRVASAWAYDVALNKNIVMKSDGRQLRSYCYCLDCASAIIKVLIDGEYGHAYNIANPDSTISIKKLAEILADYGNVELIREHPSTHETQAFNPMSNSSLNSSELQRLGWKGLFKAEDGLAHTVEILRDVLIGC